jgi:hypothetical protein
MLSGEATNTNFIVFGLTWSGLEPTSYRTRGEHANHYVYTTDAVMLSMNILFKAANDDLPTYTDIQKINKNYPYGERL